MIKTVIFDFDGTLADTLPLEFHCFRIIFSKYGKENQKNLTNDDILAMFGPTEMDMLEAELKAKDFPTASREFLELYAELHSSFVKPDAAILGMLQQLKQAGMKLAVFTGKGRLTYDISVEKLGLSEFFSVSVTGDEVEHRKPHPEGLLAAIREVDGSLSETVMVGDSNGDVIAANEAGIPCIGVHWLGTPQVKHFDVQPEVILHRPADFLQWLHLAP